MSKPYPVLGSPLRIRTKIMPNRMGFSRATPVFICGANDVRPLDTMADFAGDTARNGAGIVTLPSGKFKSGFERSAEFAQIRHSSPDRPGEEDESGFRPPEPGEEEGFDLSLDEVRIKYARAVEAVHDEGSLACISMMDIEPFGWTLDEMTTEQLEQMTDLFVEAAKSYYALGFDIMCFYMSAGMCITGMALSPNTNHRTDRFGGRTMTERAALPFEIFRRVREACPGALIENSIFADGGPGGYTFDELKEYLAAADAEGILDIVQLRSMDAVCFLQEKSRAAEPPTLAYAAELKAMNLNLKVAPVSGYWDPRKNEEFLEQGKCDFIYMAHAFLCDAEYGKKVREGRPEDIVPCLHCNKCHSRPGDPDGGCAVNPQLFLSVSDREHWQILPADRKKKVAVVGGGPAGMEAAVIAARRGHDVTLYEASGILGGQLHHTDFFSFKWSLREFRDYLIAQLGKSGCRVLMDTEATPDMIAAEGYDALIMATGAVPRILAIPGAEGKNVFLTGETLGREAELGASAVIIGGAETGTEFALHLSRDCGIKVTLLTRKNRIAGDAHPIHYREFLMMDVWNEPNLDYITHAAAEEILPNGVAYRDKDGARQVIEADSVVISAGVAPAQEYMEGFAAAVDEIYYAGDCRGPKDVRRAMKQAFNAAIRV